VVTIEGLCKAYGSRVIYDGLDLTVRRGERWCVMGRNGAGKTTLLRLIAGVLAPDAGRVTLGASLKLGYFSQQALDILNPDLTIDEHFVSHDRAFLRGLSNRVLELGGETGTDTQPHLYPGSYAEYVQRSGHEAPGVRH